MWPGCLQIVLVGGCRLCLQSIDIVDSALDGLRQAGNKAAAL
jgi:hypothetical protein